ncbi:MAG: winged helix-turn-helix transcriptional regulator, partial [Acidobacteria bacterium]|nr:winged helix-turn-helix transcriptional regulator [Acidobacteriota bacterium]
MSNPCCTPRPAPRLRQLDRLTTVYGALADATRLRILALLEDGEVCVCHIHAGLGVPQPTASRHLAFLRRAGLVSARRDGIWMHYSLARVDDPVVAAVVSS